MTSENITAGRSTFFDTKIEFLKGVGPQKAALLNEELGIFTLADLVSPDYHPVIKVVKDTAAAGVLMLAISAVLVGGIIFLPKLAVLMGW